MAYAINQLNKENRKGKENWVRNRRETVARSDKEREPEGRMRSYTNKLSDEAQKKRNMNQPSTQSAIMPKEVASRVKTVFDMTEQI